MIIRQNVRLFVCRLLGHLPHNFRHRSDFSSKCRSYYEKYKSIIIINYTPSFEITITIDELVTSITNSNYLFALSIWNEIKIKHEESVRAIKTIRYRFCELSFTLV